MIMTLALKSLRNRRFTAALTVVSIALAVALLLGVERIRHQARAAFTSTISGTDLVVGARSSPVHLLLFSVFRIGNPNNNVGWDSYRAIAGRPDIAWSVPLSLGDSHRGFRVLGTTHDYFVHLRYAAGRKLEFAQGARFEREQDAVLGAEVARSLGYGLGQPIVIAHGTGAIEFATHDEHPFRVVGILARTGTPVDRAIHVPLEGIDLIHADTGESAHDPLAAAMRAAKPNERADPRARSISAFLLGLRSRGAALSVQRQVNDYKNEALTAILPGMALLEIWEVVGTVERTLRVLSVLVVAVGLAGMLVALLTSLAERRREMAVLRSVGARPAQIFALVLGEAALLAFVGVVVGVALLYAGLIVGAPWLQAQLGFFVEPGWPSAYEAGVMLAVVLAAALVGLGPAYRSYRFSLADGMTIRT